MLAPDKCYHASPAVIEKVAAALLCADSPWSACIPGPIRDKAHGARTALHAELLDAAKTAHHGPIAMDVDGALHAPMSRLEQRRDLWLLLGVAEAITKDADVRYFGGEPVLVAG